MRLARGEGIALKLIRLLLTNQRSVLELQQPTTKVIEEVGRTIGVPPSEVHSFLFLIQGNMLWEENCSLTTLVLEMTGEEYVLSDHAIARFVERWAHLSEAKLSNPVSTLQKLFSKAVPGTLPKGHEVKRLISNGFQPAEYLVNQGWRFVIVQGEQPGKKHITTIERVK